MTFLRRLQFKLIEKHICGFSHLQQDRFDFWIVCPYEIA
jgi:hypothetical protein